MKKNLIFSRNRFWAPGLVELPGCPPESVDFPPAAKSLFGGKEKSVIFNERNGELIWFYKYFTQNCCWTKKTWGKFQGCFLLFKLEKWKGLNHTIRNFGLEILAGWSIPSKDPKTKSGSSTNEQCSKSLCPAGWFLSLYYPNSHWGVFSNIRLVDHNRTNIFKNHPQW